METDVTGPQPQTPSLFAQRPTRARAPARPSDRIRKLKAVTGRENRSAAEATRRHCVSRGGIFQAGLQPTAQDAEQACRRGCKHSSDPVGTVQKTQHGCLVADTFILVMHSFCFYCLNEMNDKIFFGGGGLDTSCVCDALYCAKNRSRVYQCSLF